MSVVFNRIIAYSKLPDPIKTKCATIMPVNYIYNKEEYFSFRLQSNGM